MTKTLRKTKIVATIGPATSSPAKIEALIKSGVNVFRIAFSHGTHEEHKNEILMVRAAEKKLGANVAIFQDLQGPKIRVGLFPDGHIMLKDGQSVSFVGGEEYDGKRIPIPVKEVIKEIKVGEHLMFGDGDIKIKVTKKVPNGFNAKVVYGGKLGSRKGLIAEGRTFSLSALTKKDFADIDYIYKNKLQDEVNFIAFSFVKNAKDIAQLRDYLKKKHKDADRQIITKFETMCAVENMDEIVEATDVIMVARGDLGMEAPFEKLALFQKQLVEKCIAKNKQVIVATNMLEHMIDNPFPTRAEVTDVSNAVFQRASAVMLSAETAMGKYPEICVQTMDKIARTIEADQSENIFKTEGADKLEMEMTRSAAYTAKNLNADAIVVFTETGHMAQLISKCRPVVPVFAFTPSRQIQKQLALAWGVYGQELKSDKNPEKVIEKALAKMKKEGITKKGHKVVIVSDIMIAKKKVETALQVRIVE